MITQKYLDSEILLARKIFLFYTDKMLSYMLVNNSKYAQWYRDSLQIGYLLGLLEEMIIESDGISIGFYTFNDNIALMTFYRIREYYIAEIDDEYITTDLGDIIIPTGKTYNPYPGDWKEVVYDITSDSTNSFTLPFIYSLIDPESLIVTIEGYGVIEQTISGEGYHITNNIFYWHHYFKLNTGAKVHFRYKQILV